MAEYIEREAVLDICNTEYQSRLQMFDYCGDLRTNGFQDRLVMTTSIPLHILFSTQHFVALICAPLADCFASIAF